MAHEVPSAYPAPQALWQNSRISTPQSFHSVDLYGPIFTAEANMILQYYKEWM